jgi:hypothetical protein
MYLFFTIFSVYLFVLCPSIYVGDSALLTAASFSLGTAHPPAYPLYVLLGKLITFLPFGSIGFKLNLISSLFGALAACVVFRCVLYMTENRYAAWASGLFLAVVPLFWGESSKAEVYTLNAFICSVILFATLKMIREDGSFYRQSFFLAFLIGLGMANHHTAPLMGLAAIPVFLARWRELRFRWLFFMIIFFAAGLSVNLLIYIRSRVAVTSGIEFLYSFGGTFDTLMFTFLRKTYETGTAASLTSATTSFFANFIKANLNVLKLIILPNMHYASLPVVFIGLFKIFKERRFFIYTVSLLFFWITFLGVVASAGSAAKEDIDVISVYFIQVFLIISVVFGAGIAFILEKVSLRWQGSFLPGFISCAAVALPLSLAPQAYGVAHSNQHALAYTFARDMLSVLPVNSMIIHYDDNPSFTSYYMQAAERFRDDVMTIYIGGKNDVYGMGSAPAWKYRMLHPDFFATHKMDFGYLDREFASKGKLFTSDPRKMSKAMTDHYSLKMWPLTATLYPRGFVPNESITEDLFLGAYDFLDYDTIRSLPHLDDFFAVELVNHYALTSIIYGDIMNRNGYAEAGRKAIEESMSLADPKKFLGTYIKYLLDNNREAYAFDFLGALEKSPDEYLNATAHILEYKLLSAVGRNEDAEKKYDYLRKNNLMAIGKPGS